MAKIKFAGSGKKKPSAVEANAGLIPCLVLLFIAALLAFGLLWLALASG